MDAVFKALADESRRQLLDQLRRSSGQALGELSAHLDMTRQAVTKHLRILERARLVTVVWRGREKLHYLNPVPIHEISRRWIGKYERPRLEALGDLKRDLEEAKPTGKSDLMEKPKLVYATYIRTTPKKLWAAITKPEFTRQYWGGLANVSDWKKGSPWKHVTDDKEPETYVTGKVVESTPPTRLVLTWADPDDLADESRVTFEIEAIEDMTCLTVTHGSFKAGSTMVKKVSFGWPRVLSSLKSFLETGKGLNVWAGR